MILTPLEIGLLGTLTATGGVILTKNFLKGSFVEKKNCDEKREVLGDRLQSVETTQKALCRMVRGLVTYSSIPADKKEHILNEE